ncbi:MAG: agmatinase [Candidatus Methanomethyliales bacterium]|nr:agmatinase [Candidatus Methanomethylicales archaeon]
MSGSFYVDDFSKQFGGFKREYSESEFVLFGVPFDSTSSFRPGSRFGPAAIRETSANIETWSWRTGMDFEEVRLHDLGDLAVVHGDTAETIRRVKETVEDIVMSRKIPVMLGGEHIITLGALRGIRDTTVVSFDAHFDMRDEYLTNKLSHACVMRRALEELGVGNVVIVGARASYKDEIEFVKRNGINYASSQQIIRAGTKEVGAWLKEILANSNKVYITVDMDVLDPAYAPGVGNPEPEGVSTSNLLDILEEIVDDRVVGFDVVETAPVYDNGTTALTASKIIYELCCMVAKSIRF